MREEEERVTTGAARTAAEADDAAEAAAADLDAVRDDLDAANRRLVTLQGKAWTKLLKTSFQYIFLLFLHSSSLKALHMVNILQHICHHPRCLSEMAPA